MAVGTNTQPTGLRPGSKAFAVHAGRLVFLQRDDDPAIENPGRWNLPGGAIEPGEAHRETMLREFEEELGIRPGNVKYLGWHVAPTRPLVHRYLIRLTADEAQRLRLGNEGQRFGFFRVDELPALHTSDRLKRYLNSILPHLRDIVEDGLEPDPARLGLDPGPL